MSTQNKIREALKFLLERSKGVAQYKGTELLYYCGHVYPAEIAKIEAALSELEAPPSQTDDLEARAREWWLKTIMLVDETTRPDTKMALSRSASADQATEMLAAFARSLSQPSAPTVDQITLEGEQSDPCGTITVKVRMSDGREVEAIRTNANSIYHTVTLADPAFGK